MGQRPGELENGIVVAPTITEAPEPFPLPVAEPPAQPGPALPIMSLQPASRSLPPRSTTPHSGALHATPATPRGKTRRWRALVAGGIALAAAGVLATRHHPSKTHPHQTTVRVSGYPSPRVTPSGARERWPTGGVVPIVLDPSLNLESPDAMNAVMAAFGTWAGASTGAPQVTFTVAAAPGVAAQDGVNRILYAPITQPGLETAVAMTISYADEDGVVFEADTIVNNAYSFTIVSPPPPAPSPGSAAPAAGDCTVQYDVQNVATHEAGHFLGLGEDMTDETNTMFIASQPCQTHKRILTSEDVAAMTGLYAGAPDTPAGSAGGCGS